MPYELKGRNVLVTGGSRGLGELICYKFAAEGCNVAINYNASEDRAKAVLEKVQNEHGVKGVIIQADMGIEADCIRLIHTTISSLGGLDIIISNAGYTQFRVPFTDLTLTTPEDWDLCYAVNVKAQHILLRTAQPTFESNAEGGVMIITSSIAGEGCQGSSMPYSVTKAAQLHLMRCLARSVAPKTRVNAVLPGLLLTEWGNKYSPEKIKELKEDAWLKKETDLDDTAQAYVDVARNKSMTGQKIQIDAGLLNVA